jgi:TonB-dependent SusC/RagA subfamily outer membrane receptor
MKRLHATIGFFLLTVYSFADPMKSVIPSFLKEATVYRIGAELIHTAKANLAAGSNELIIEGISNRVDINSIQVGTEGKVTILSLEFSNDYLKSGIKSATIIRLEDSIERLNKEYAQVQVQIKTAKELLDLLKANKQIGGTQSGLSVAELVKMMDYYKSKTLELESDMSVQREKEARLLESIGKLRLQIQEEENKNTRSSGKLLLQVLSPLAGTYNFTISYITPSAFWNASYDMKAESISKPINISYKAKLVQTTGIDWKNVKLTLATSTPSQQGTAPVFQTWFLGYINPVAKMEATLSNSIPSMLEGRAAGLVVTRAPGAVDRIRGYGSVKPGEAPLYVVSGEVMSEEEFKQIDPNMIRKIEVIKDASATSIYGARAANGVIMVTMKDGSDDYVTMNDNELNVTFAIDVPYDVPTNGKEQQVILREFSVPSFFKYYSAPKLDKESYLLAEVSEWEGLNLLPGEANIMFEGTYVGKTYIDPNSTQDTLNLTIGRDKRVVVKREKMQDYSSVKFLGSNKKQVFTYEITVKNNKKEKVDMILKDQYPLSSNKDIEVELLESSDAAINGDLGVLTWKLQLEPGQQKKYRISYSVKYPKDKIVNL